MKKSIILNLRWKILILRYLRVLVKVDFLTKENENLEKDLSSEMQQAYNGN